MLHNIASTVPNWSKVNSGLLKMYNEEVLKKVPVVQHFWFGGILGWRDKETKETLSSTGDGREKEVEEEEAVRQTSEGTVAPWSIPTSEGFTSVPSTIPMPVTKAPWANQSTTTSTTTSTPFGRQTVPTSFNPPPFFPPRGGPVRSTAEGSTLADSGGAASSSSPFGVLSAPSVGKSTKGLPWEEEK